MAKEESKTSLKSYTGGVGKSPLPINVTLVKGARLTNYYSGGSSSTSPGEYNTDLIFDPIKKELEDMMSKKPKKKKKCECKEKSGGLTKTYTGTINAETGECECQGKGDDTETDDGTPPEDDTRPKEKKEEIPPEEEEVIPEEEEVIPPEEEEVIPEEEEIIPEEEEETIPEEEEETNPTKNPPPKPKNEKDTKEQIKEGENALNELNQSVNLRFSKPKENKKQDYTNPNPTIIPGLDQNHPLSRMSGGGDINGTISKSKTHKNGKIATLPNSGKANGVKYSMDTKFSKDGKTITFKFIEGDKKYGSESAFGRPPFKPKGEYTVQEWDNLVDVYRQNLSGALKIVMQANAKDLSFKERKDILKSLTRAEKVALRMHSRGFNNLKMSEIPKKPKKNSPTGYKEQTAADFEVVPSSPFARRDMTFARVRDKWRPTQQPTEPLAYASPLHQEEYVTETPEEQAGMTGAEMPPPPDKTLWDVMDEYGGLPAINSKVESFVNSIDYNPEFDKPLKAMKSGDYSKTVTDFANSLAEELKQAGLSKDNKSRQNIMSRAEQLIRDINTYASKFLDWSNMKAGDKTPGNIGGDMTSKGSDKTFDFNLSTIMMGDPGVAMGITSDGRIHFKRTDIDGLVSVGDLDKGVFLKNYEGIQMFTESQKAYHGNAIEGLPLNKSQTDGIVSGILQTKSALLSWAHDNNSGKSWVTEYAETHPGEDLSWAMPESEQFDYDRLHDEVHGWMSHKLNEAYTDVSGTKAKKPDPDAARQMLSALQNPIKPQQPQQPQQEQTEGSAMVYKTKAQQLIEKYSPSTV